MEFVPDKQTASRFVPDQATGKTGDPITDAPVPGTPEFDALSKRPVKKGLDFPGSRAVGNVETLLSLGGGMLGTFTGAVGGLGRVLTGGTGKEAEQTLRGAQDFFSYNPRTEVGQENVSTIGKAVDVSKLAGLGPTEALAIGAAPKPSVSLPSATRLLPGTEAALSINKTPAVAPAANVPRPAGVGATKVVGELQRQRDVMEGKSAPIRDAEQAGKAPSVYEKALTEFEDKIEPIKKEALNLPARVDSAPTLDLIKQLESQNPDSKVRAALGEVRKTINRAQQSSQATNLPAAGSRMTPAQLKAMQGQSGQMSVSMLDEVRQSINRLIEAKGEGALDAHTQAVLGKVRDDLVSRSPGIYQKYLQQYAEGKKGLDVFNPEQTGLSKLTGTEPGYQPLRGSEAQQAIETAMTGKRATRDLTELVKATGHDAEAANSLRQSFAEWMTSPDPVTGAPRSKDMVKRWSEVRSDAVDSGLITKEHAADIDAAVKSVRDADRTGSIKKAGAWLFGFITPGRHPFMAAGAARAGVEALMGQNAAAKMESAIMRAAMQPEVAKAMNGPVTRANIEKIKATLPTDLVALIPIPEEQGARQDFRSMEPAPFRGMRSQKGNFVRG